MCLYLTKELWGPFQHLLPSPASDWSQRAGSYEVDLQHSGSVPRPRLATTRTRIAEISTALPTVRIGTSFPLRGGGLILGPRGLVFVVVVELNGYERS